MEKDKSDLATEFDIGALKQSLEDQMGTDTNEHAHEGNERARTYGPADETITLGSGSALDQAYKHPGEIWQPSAKQTRKMRRLLQDTGCHPEDLEGILALWGSGLQAKQAVEETAWQWKRYYIEQQMAA